MREKRMSLLEQAIAIALKAHAGQRRKDGRPTILHPLHVMMQMETELEMITAVLHDVVEDSAITLADLRACGFPEEVLTAVFLLTHEDEIPYDEYIMALKGNPLARRIKLVDLEHNMDIRDLPDLTEADWERLRRYGRAWAVLQR
jgi:(p)ppGpp synthase/HD superfamily hydrolase